MVKIYTPEMDAQLLSKELTISALSEKWGLTENALRERKKVVRKRANSDIYKRPEPPPKRSTSSIFAGRFARPSFFEEDLNDMARGRR